MPLLLTQPRRLKIVRAGAETLPVITGKDDLLEADLLACNNHNAMTLFLDYTPNATGTPGYAIKVWYWNGKEGDSATDNEGAKLYEDIIASQEFTAAGRVAYSFNLLASWVYIQVSEIDEDGAAPGVLFIDYAFSNARAL